MQTFKPSSLLEDLASCKHLNYQAYSSTSKKVSIHFNTNTCGKDVINFGIIDHYKAWISKHFNMISINKKTIVYDLRQWQQKNAKINIRSNACINPPSSNA